MLSLRDLTYTEIATRIILSVLFGGILGMEPVANTHMTLPTTSDV